MKLIFYTKSTLQRRMFQRLHYLEVGVVGATTDPVVLPGSLSIRVHGDKRREHRHLIVRRSLVIGQAVVGFIAKSGWPVQRLQRPAGQIIARPAEPRLTSAARKLHSLV